MAYDIEENIKGAAASIDDLNGLYQGKAVTTYGKVINICDSGNTLQFTLVDLKSKSTLNCEISKDFIEENPERREVLMDSEKSESGVYVNGIYQLGLMNRKIDVRKVFVP